MTFMNIVKYDCTGFYQPHIAFYIVFVMSGCGAEIKA